MLVGWDGRVDHLELLEEHIGTPGRHVEPSLPGWVQAGLKHHEWVNGYQRFFGTGQLWPWTKDSGLMLG